MDKNRVNNNSSAIVCPYCGEELKTMQIRTPFRAKKQMRVIISCECELERQRQIDQVEKRQGIMKILNHRGFQMGKYAEMTLANCHHHPDIVEYIKFVGKSGRNWLYIYGGAGVGKTFNAIAAARQLAIERHWKPMILRWAEYCAQSWDERRTTLSYEQLNNTDIFILDDFDKTCSNFGKLFDLIDNRYTHNLPVIIIANRCLVELTKWWSHEKQHDEIKKAIMSRIMGQMFKVINLQGEDYRLNVA